MATTGPAFTIRALRRMTPYHHGRIKFRALDRSLSSIQGLRAVRDCRLLLYITLRTEDQLQLVCPIADLFSLSKSKTPTRLKTSRGLEKEIVKRLG